MAYIHIEDQPALKTVEFKMDGSLQDVTFILLSAMMTNEVFLVAVEIALKMAADWRSEGHQVKFVKNPPAAHPSQN